MTSLPRDSHPPDSSELLDLAHRMRTAAWPLSVSWDSAAKDLGRTNLGKGSTPLERFGSVPAFIAALARHLERLAEDSAAMSHARLAADKRLQKSAADHAHQRAASGFAPRDLFVEFVALRQTLWNFLAEGEQRLGLETERAVQQVLDAVIVETADRFFGELTNELAWRADRDSLTGLFNRAAFAESAESELTRAQRFGRQFTIALIDLDAFKLVNDTRGHATGDAVLKRIAGLLETHTRDNDIVGRLGGDEFAVALVEADPEVARNLERRLRIHLVPTRRQLGLPAEFGLSVGIASSPDDGTMLEQLLIQADSRMYKAKGAQEANVLEVTPPQSLDKLDVMVVDDDPGIRVLCRAALENIGFRVREASDGGQALQLVRESRPDLILLDITMPIKDGWSVATELAEDAATAQIPIVVMTGRASEETLDRAFESGAKAFIDKPFDPQSLANTVHAVIEAAAVPEQNKPSQYQRPIRKATG